VGAYPQVVDWNGDSKKDLLCGDASGKVLVFINTGTAEKPVLAAGVPVLAAGKPITGNKTKYSKIHYADWNGDGLKDLMIGQDGPGAGSSMFVHVNAGTAKEPKLGKPQEILLPGPRMTRPSPYLVDWDRDGNVDLLCGTDSNRIYFFRNTGTHKPYAMGVPLKLEGFKKNCRCRLDVTDWNNDGKLDLLVGDFNSSARGKSTGYIWLFLGK